MVDPDRISKAKADILAIIQQVEAVLRGGKELFLSDPKNSLALKYLLIEAVEAIVEICQHILARTKGIACEGYVDCIMKAAKEAIISLELGNKLRRLADLRNSLVHRYWVIDDEQLYLQTSENSSDLIEFVNQIDLFLKPPKVED